jgi:hypothetical protein
VSPERIEFLPKTPSLPGHIERFPPPHSLHLISVPCSMPFLPSTHVPSVSSFFCRVRFHRFLFGFPSSFLCFGKQMSHALHDSDDKYTSCLLLLCEYQPPPTPQFLYIIRLATCLAFLDTRLYNAHTLAVDALWAGVPLVTYPNTAFASRVSSSLLIPSVFAPFPHPPPGFFYRPCTLQGLFYGPAPLNRRH